MLHPPSCTNVLINTLDEKQFQFSNHSSHFPIVLRKASARWAALACRTNAQSGPDSGRRLRSLQMQRLSIQVLVARQDLKMVLVRSASCILLRSLQKSGGSSHPGKGLPALSVHITGFHPQTSAITLLICLSVICFFFLVYFFLISKVFIRLIPS